MRAAIRAALGGVMLAATSSLPAIADDVACPPGAQSDKSYFFAPEARKHLLLKDTRLSDDAKKWLEERPRDTEYHDLHDAGRHAGKTILGNLEPHRPGVHKNPFYVVQGDLNLSGIAVCGSLTLKNMVVEGNLVLKRAHIEKDLVVDNILVRGDLDLSGAEIGGKTTLASLTIRRDVFLSRSVKDTTTGESRLLAAAPRGELRVEQLIVGGDFSTSGLRPGGDVYLQGITTGTAKGSDGKLDLSCWDTSATLISLNIERAVVAGQFTLGANTCRAGHPPSDIKFDDLLISGGQFNGPDRTQFQGLEAKTVQLFSNIYRSETIRFDKIVVTESFTARGEQFLGKDIRFQSGTLPSPDFEMARFGGDQNARVRFVNMDMAGVVNFKNVEVAGELALEGGSWGLIDARSMQSPADVTGPESAHLNLEDVAARGLALEDSRLGALRVSGTLGVDETCAAGTHVALDLRGSTITTLALQEGTFNGLVNLTNLSVPASGFSLGWEQLENRVIAGQSTIGECEQQPALVLEGNADHTGTLAAYRLLEQALSVTGTREDRNKVMYLRKCMKDEGNLYCSASPPSMLSLVPAGCFSGRWLDCINGYGLALLRPVIYAILLIILFRLIIGWGFNRWGLMAGSGFISKSFPIEPPGAPNIKTAAPNKIRQKLTDFAIRAVTFLNLSNAVLISQHKRGWSIAVAVLRIGAFVLFVALIDALITIAPDLWQRITEVKGAIS